MAVDGGYDAFSAFVATRQTALLRAAYLLTGDRGLAEDLVQEALTKLALRWDRVGTGHPEAFVRTVIFRDSVSWFRRHRRERVGPPPDRPGPDGSDALTLRIPVLEALAQLTRAQRAVVVLRYYEDLTERQTAEALGIAVGTVKSQAREALARLRALVPDLTVDEGREPSRAGS